MSASALTAAAKDVAVFRVHRDVSDGGEVLGLDVDEDVLDVGVHQRFEPVGVDPAESDLFAQVRDISSRIRWLQWISMAPASAR
jgi:hypothetical protein